MSAHTIPFAFVAMALGVAFAITLGVAALLLASE